MALVICPSLKSKSLHPQALFMLGWIFASSFVVSPSYGGKKQRCFELDMVERTELGLLPTADGLHLQVVSNLSYMVVLECGKVVLG
jgi:hypothetical protein